MDNTAQGDAKSKIALLRGLRQVRQFRPDPVPQAALDDILQVGRWTGSGNNRQPWEFVVVRDPKTLQAIAEAEGAGSFLPGASAAIVIVMAGTSPEIESYDEGRLTERLMLAAGAHGLGAGIWWYKDGGAAAKRILSIPEARRVRAAIGLGYPAERPAGQPKKTDTRRPLSDLVHEEHY